MFSTNQRPNRHIHQLKKKEDFIKKILTPIFSWFCPNISVQFPWKLAQ